MKGTFRSSTASVSKHSMWTSSHRPKPSASDRRRQTPAPRDGIFPSETAPQEVKKSFTSLLGGLDSENPTFPNQSQPKDPLPNSSQEKGRPTSFSTFAGFKPPLKQRGLIETPFFTCSGVSSNLGPTAIILMFESLDRDRPNFFSTPGS